MADLTYLELIAQVTGDLNRDDLDAVAREKIQDRIEYYFKEYFYSAEVVDDTITTGPGTRYYPIPGPPRWAAVNRVRVFSGNWIDLDKKSNAEIDEMDVLTSALQSLPSFWCGFGGQVRIWPCGGGYPLELILDRGPVAPVNDSDITFWSTDAQTLIKAAACEMICNLTLNDPTRAMKFEKTRISEESALNSKSIKAKGGLKFKPYL